MRVRAILALAIASLWLLVAPASSAVARPVAYPPTTCATLSVSTTNPIAGATVTVTGKNFAANASIRLELHTTVFVLATVTSDANGAFSVDVTLPAGVTGQHRIVAIGGDNGVKNCPADVTQIVDIQAVSASSSSAPGSGGGPAVTGFDIAALLGAAALLIGVGVFFNRRGNARRSATHS